MKLFVLKSLAWHLTYSKHLINSIIITLPMYVPHLYLPLGLGSPLSWHICIFSSFLRIELTYWLSRKSSLNLSVRNKLPMSHSPLHLSLLLLIMVIFYFVIVCWHSLYITINILEIEHVTNSFLDPLRGAEPSASTHKVFLLSVGWIKESSKSRKASTARFHFPFHFSLWYFVSWGWGSIVSFQWKFNRLISFQNILDMIIGRDVILAQFHLCMGGWFFLITCSLWTHLFMRLEFYA